MERALDLLEVIADGEQSVVQAARALDVDKSTASRLLSTLASRGFLSRSIATGAFRLGPTIPRLYHAYTQVTRLGREASPLIEWMARQTGETVVLTSYEGGVATYVDKIESGHRLRASSRVGAVAPFHCGAAGKSILAFLTPQEADRALGSGPLHPYTAKTITSRRKLAAEMERIRRDGFSVSIEELDEGIVGVGVPLMRMGDAPVGAISVVGPLVRMHQSRRVETAQFLLRAAHAWRVGELPEDGHISRREMGDGSGASD